MGSFKFGFGGTLGNKVANGVVSLTATFLVCGALRGGFVELAEHGGHPEDGRDLISFSGLLSYSWDNVEDVYDFITYAQEELKDEPQP
ncbi:MAG: hypothetical protein AAF204_01575 [Pseudomonadota bacterium]